MTNINSTAPLAATAGMALGPFQGPGSTANPGEEFEAVVFAQLIRQMRQTASEDGLFPGDRSDTMGGMFDLFLGRHSR